MSDPNIGPDFRIEVQDYKSVANPKPYVPVEDITNYERSKSRSSTSTPVFHRSVPRRTRNAREITFTISGLMNLEDPGQSILRMADEEDVPVNIRVLPNGVDGFTQFIEVNTQNHSTNAEGFQETRFECSATEEKVAVGLGTDL